MKYYRVNQEFDGRPLYKKKKNDYGFPIPNGYCLVAGELYTAKEVERLNVPLQAVMPVNISKNNTFFMFGARFKKAGAKEWY